MMIVKKDGYRFIQGLIPAKMHRELTEASKKAGQSRSEMLRNSIEAFLKNTKTGTVRDDHNGL